MTNQQLVADRRAALRWSVASLVWLILAISLGCSNSPSTQAQDESRPDSPIRWKPEFESQLSDLWTRANGEDWPSFLGPRRNSTSSETGLIAPWPKQGLRIVWQKEIATSYGIGSVSKGRFFHFDRPEDQARLSCLNAETGKLIWQFAYPTDYVDLYGYNGGPRASPVIDGNRVYIFGVEGMLHCLRASDGQLVWKVDTTKEFGVVQNFFGVGSTPIVEGDLLLTMIGGSAPAAQFVAPGQLDRVQGNGSAIVAFDKLTGQLKYKISDELASYSSPTVATIGGRRWAFAFARGGLLAFEPSSGEIDFHYPWRASILESVNASTPVIVGDEVFISETYSIGSSLLRVKPGGYDIVWQDDRRKRDKAFKAHWNTPVYVDGYLYGASGRNPPDAELRCIEWKTGKVMWSIPTQDRSSLLLVDGHLVLLGEYGLLQLFKPNPQKFDLVSEVEYRQTTDAVAGLNIEPPRLLKSPCWAAPIISHGLLFVRGDDRLLCLEAIPAKR